MIDARLLLHDQEEITAGEAVAGMILNGLGFANRPLLFTRQFFADKPLDLLFHESVRAEMSNRLKLGRTPDDVLHALHLSVQDIVQTAVRLLDVAAR